MTDAELPQTMALQGLANRLVNVLLRTPLISQGAGRRLVTIYAVGRKSGKRYAVPVAYTRHEGSLLVGTPFRWARNLRTGEPVQLRYLGRLRTADVHVDTDEEPVMAGYAVIARDNHNFARFNRITLDGDGNPDPADLRRAWQAGARLLRFTLVDATSATPPR
jgi:hypothetical protein